VKIEKLLSFFCTPGMDNQILSLHKGGAMTPLNTSLYYVHFRSSGRDATWGL